MKILKDQFTNIYGENPTKFDLILINAAALTSGVLIAWGVPEIRENLSLIHKLILVVIAWDINGGIIANLTRSTNTYIMNADRYSRYWFYSLHVIQPLVIFAVSSVSIDFFIFCWVFTVGASVMISEVIPYDRRHAVAGFMLAMGIIYYTYFITVPLEWKWFGYAFMVKLIFGQALDHHGVLDKKAREDEPGE